MSHAPRNQVSFNNYSSYFLENIANAASMKKRGISAPVQVCRDHLDAIDAQIPIVHNMLNDFETADGINYTATIHNAKQVLLGHMKKSGADCCSVTGIITDEEADAMLITVTPVIPKATNALALLIEKKPTLDSIILVTHVAKADVRDLYTNTAVIYTCILDIGSAQHPTYIPIINDYINQLNTAFTNTYSVYGIK
ncbi:hypothetical protein MFLAVUS_004254 [Mucor flavus]|uniref:Uncharacterized protein n=1 Tax=Mucor flavus TaxID=439312 RepID=A0ABP9YVF2_9FUNG